MFAIFPTVSILDTLDKSGKDAYTSSSMALTISRVPDALFDKSAPIPAPALYVPPVIPPPISTSAISARKTTSIKKSITPTPIARSSSKLSSTKPKTDGTLISSKKAKSGKLGKTAIARKSKSTPGLMFPAARLKRKLK